MNKERQHRVSVIDFVRSDHNTIFVKVVGFDAELGKEFEGEIRFLDDMLYGDLIHPERSPLSASCREAVRNALKNKFSNGEFF